MQLEFMSMPELSGWREHKKFASEKDFSTWVRPRWRKVKVSLDMVLPTFLSFDSVNTTQNLSRISMLRMG